MTPEQFTYWLQGFFEMENPVVLNKKQVQQIKDHLKEVFIKKTPDRNQKRLKNICITDDDFIFNNNNKRYC